MMVKQGGKSEGRPKDDRLVYVVYDPRKLSDKLHEYLTAEEQNRLIADDLDKLPKGWPMIRRSEDT
jgi:hypothetical protein